MAIPDNWGKYALISMESGTTTTVVEFGARTEDVDIKEGARDGDVIANIDGSFLWIDKPQEVGTITLKMRPVSLVATTAAGGVFQQYRGGAVDASDPLLLATGTAGGATLLATFNRELFRVAILWTNDTAAVAAAGAVTAGKQSLRFWCQYARITNHEFSYNGKETMVNVTLKFPPRSNAGVWNYGWESSDASALVALDTTLGAWSTTEA